MLSPIGTSEPEKSHAGVVLRVRVPNTGSVVELSSKFGADPSEAVTLLRAETAIGHVEIGYGMAAPAIAAALR